MSGINNMRHKHKDQKPEQIWDFGFRPDFVKLANFGFPILSGLLLTAAFPKIGADWLAWFALIPLLFALKDCSVKEGLGMGFLAGLAHYLTLLYWLVYTMQIYGELPLYLCVPLLFLFAAFLALYAALFSAALIRVCAAGPHICALMIPILWVSLEYIRSFLFSGFPWELLGYSQIRHLYLIQIADICGVYGVSFLIALCNGVLFLGLLCFGKKEWQGMRVSKHFAGGAAAVFVLAFVFVWGYGKWRVNTVDKLISESPSLRVAVIQGNIDQSEKWDPAFRNSTIKRYNDLSFSVKTLQPDLLVWPETATPFYFLHNKRRTEMVMNGIFRTGTNFLIGSPSFVRRGKDDEEYHNSAYLIFPSGEVAGRYDKTHLVPFGEYVPFKEWLPFIGKIVEHVGDFTPGRKGDTLKMGDHRVGVQICYEIIFPPLSREMVKNGAGLLANITNDAWYGKTAAPYQHFSMIVFRAVENKRSLARSANTGISGFVDPAGRIMAKTRLFEDAALTRDLPILKEMTFYTRLGDLFAMGCVMLSLLVLSMCLKKDRMSNPM